MSGKRCVNTAVDNDAQPNLRSACKEHSVSFGTNCLLCWCTCAGCGSEYPRAGPSPATPAPEPDNEEPQKSCRGRAARRRERNKAAAGDTSTQPSPSTGGGDGPKTSQERTATSPGAPIGHKTGDVLSDALARRAEEGEQDAAERCLEGYDALASVLSVPTDG